MGRSPDDYVRSEFLPIIGWFTRRTRYGQPGNSVAGGLLRMVTCASDVGHGKRRRSAPPLFYADVEVGMEDSFEDYVAFAPIEERAISSTHCGVCRLNLSVLQYQKHGRSAGRRVEQSGYCCTDCASSMLLQVANEEVEEWVGLAET